MIFGSSRRRLLAALALCALVLAAAAQPDGLEGPQQGVGDGEQQEPLDVAAADAPAAAAGDALDMAEFADDEPPPPDQEADLPPLAPRPRLPPTEPPGPLIEPWADSAPPPSPLPPPAGTGSSADQQAPAAGRRAGGDKGRRSVDGGSKAASGGAAAAAPPPPSGASAAGHVTSRFEEFIVVYKTGTVGIAAATNRWVAVV
jgi:hypothetical protein